MKAPFRGLMPRTVPEHLPRHLEAISLALQPRRAEAEHQAVALFIDLQELDGEGNRQRDIPWRFGCDSGWPGMKPLRPSTRTGRPLHAFGGEFSL